MLINVIRRLLPKDVSPTTYGLGILQAKTYRVLKTVTADHLADIGITTVDWAILGTLFDHPEGMRPSDLGQYLGVRSPLITLRVNRLLKQKLIERTISPADSRGRILLLSPKGKRIVPRIDRTLREGMRPFFQDCSVRDLIGFVRVMSNVSQAYVQDEMDE